jgi:predicted RNA-binding Zn ribbon-like protein
VVIAMPVTLPGCVTCQTGDVQHEFVTGNLALDYVATVAERGTTHVEHLVAPEDLAEWIEQAGIVDDPVAVTSAGLERAKAVREALFALVEATIDGEPVPREALRAVNEAAAAPPPRPALRDAALRREGDLDAVLSALARAALELLGGPEGQVVRRRGLHAPVRRPLTRRQAALVRDGRLWRPREGGRLPRSPARPLGARPGTLVPSGG